MRPRASSGGRPKVRATKAHAQRVREHVEGAAEAGQLQGVGDVVAAAPVPGAGLVVGHEARMRRGEVDRVDMGLEPGPAREAELARDQPLGVGQPWCRSAPAREKGRWRGGAAIGEPLEQFLGALALLLEVDVAAAGRGAMGVARGVGHTNSSVGRVRCLAGSRMGMRWGMKPGRSPFRGREAWKTPTPILGAIYLFSGMAARGP
jgi:hypothetical protein